MEETIKAEAVASMEKVQSKLEDRIRKVSIFAPPSLTSLTLVQKPDSKVKLRKKADKRIATITAKCDRKIAEMHASFDQSSKMLIDSYDKCVTTHLRTYILTFSHSKGI